jgi:hypothetical protein
MKDAAETGGGTGAATATGAATMIMTAEDMMTGAETTEDSIRNEGGRGVVMPVTKTIISSCGETVRRYFLFCDRHRDAFFGWCRR